MTLHVSAIGLQQVRDQIDSTCDLIATASDWLTDIASLEGIDDDLASVLLRASQRLDTAYTLANNAWVALGNA